MQFPYFGSYCGCVKAVVCDWSGTTVDYGSVSPANVFVAVFRRQGVEITPVEARGPMGMYKKDHIRCLTKVPRIAEAWKAIHHREPGEDDVERMFHDFVPLQLETIADYADPVPGCVETIESLKARGIKIGSSTGYNQEMMDILVPAAKALGFETDVDVCASDVPAGRPAPWMLFENMKRLDVYPVEAVVKVDDTVHGIYAGLNAGVWTVGVVKTGNQIGLTLEEIGKLPEEELARRMEIGYRKMAQSGAHYVIDGIEQIGPVIDDIERRMRQGEKPQALLSPQRTLVARPGPPVARAEFSFLYDPRGPAEDAYPDPATLSR